MSIADLVHEATFGEVAYSADECLKCNVCNTVCPVARVTDLFPGPKYVGPQAQRFRSGTALTPYERGLPKLKAPDLTVDYCSGCGLCTTACPAEVKIAEMNNRARAFMRADRGVRFRDWLLGQTDLVGRLGVLFSPIANWTLRNRPIRWLIQRIIGIHGSAPLPAFARRTFRSRWSAAEGARRRSTGEPEGEPGPDRAVVYFHGCSANYYEPHVAAAAISVLRRNGYETIVPPQVCCGLPLISNGLYAGATSPRAQEPRPHWQATRDVGTGSWGRPRPARTPSRPSTARCWTSTTTTRASWRRRPGTSASSSSACTRTASWTPASAAWTRSSPITRHASSAATASAFRRSILFALVPGLRAVDMDHDCCGIAGTYGLKNEKYGIAMAVGELLFKKVRAAGAARAACDSETCRWQIQGE